MARTPLYKTAETEMIRRIRTGAWPVGQRLPNEFGLAAEFGVSQGTMRRALMTLEAMGLLDRKPGRGTLVAGHAATPGRTPPAAPAPPGQPGPGRLQDARGAPLMPEVFRARSGSRAATPEEAALFATPHLATLERTLLHDGARAALDMVTVPASLIPSLDEDAAPDLAELLADAGHPPAAIADLLTAAVTSMSESVALSCDRHTALIVLTRTARDADGTVLARQTLRLIAEGVSYSA